MIDGSCVRRAREFESCLLLNGNILIFCKTEAQRLKAMKFKHLMKRAIALCPVKPEMLKVLSISVLRLLKM